MCNDICGRNGKRNYKTAECSFAWTILLNCISQSVAESEWVVVFVLVVLMAEAHKIFQIRMVCMNGSRVWWVAACGHWSNINLYFKLDDVDDDDDDINAECIMCKDILCIGWNECVLDQMVAQWPLPTQRILNAALSTSAKSNQIEIAQILEPILAMFGICAHTRTRTAFNVRWPPPTSGQ